MSGCRVIALFSRASGLSHEEFVDRYENGHVPLVKRLLPPFDSYSREYVGDAEARSTLGYDVITIASFASDDAYHAVTEAMADPVIADALARDEAQFIARDRSIIFSANSHE